MASPKFNRFYRQTSPESTIVVTLPPKGDSPRSWTFRQENENHEALLKKAQEAISGLPPGTQVAFTLLDKRGEVVNSITLRRKRGG